MDRTVNPQILAIALGEHAVGVLPTPDELAELIAQVEVGAIRDRTSVSEELLGTAWYLHGVTAAAQGTELYDPVRRRHAFAVSAHILDLALKDAINPSEQEPTDNETRPQAEPPDPGAERARRLSLAFAAQIGYRRCEQDPNAAAVFRRVDDDLIVEDSLASHLDTLGVEAGVALLGMQRRRLALVLRVWRRQLRDLRRLAEVDNLRTSMYGPAEAVVEGVHQIMLYLTHADGQALERAEGYLRDAASGGAGRTDRSSRWVAAHLLEILDDLSAGSLQRLLPPGVPPALARAFTLSDPPVMTLWPPQRELLTHASPLDPATSRLLISVPTNAGKTLMAQLVICAHLAAGSSRVLYVSPLRSLGREMRQALRSRLRVLGRTIGGETPDFPAPDAHPITGDADVEVLTPERLMHALRQDPVAALENIGLIVVDEAHHIQQSDRGFLLEGLLAFCQAHPRPPRLVLLSAAIGNHAALAQWLDPDQPAENVVFSSQWRGARRLHGLLSPLEFDRAFTRTARNSTARPTEAVMPMGLRMSMRPTSTGRVYEMGTLETAPLGRRIYREKRPGDTSTSAPGSVTNYQLFAFGAAHLSRAGSVLVVCDSRDRARDNARAVASYLPEFPPAAPLAQLLADTLGTEHPIVACVRRGVAYHHALLPAEVLRAVEDTLRAEQLKVVCCTTTLTDGVNLPVRSVIVNASVEDGRPPTWEGQRKMGPAQVLNAVGRAGRGGRESEGWILLTRHYPPSRADFDLLDPAANRLEVMTTLGTQEALADLAEAERLIAETADGVFALAKNYAADFAAYVWFTLDALSRIPTLTPAPPMAAVNRLLAMRQLDDEIKDRWLRLADHVAQAYAASAPGARRRWTTPGTSIGSARTLDGLADDLARTLIDENDSTDWAFPGLPADSFDVFQGAFPEQWPLQDTLDFLARNDVYTRLLELPESDKAWKFTETKRKMSPSVAVDIAAAITGWITGTPIPDLASQWLPTLPREWALEQTVNNISSAFEHYLAWTVGALINLINIRLEQAHMDFRLPTTAGWHLRHGVDTTQALALLNAGITSRRLAHEVGRAAQAQGISTKQLRPWLTDLHLDAWRSEFRATPYEALELLEYVRKSRSSLIGGLLEDGTVSLEVIPREDSFTEPVQLRFADGPSPAPLLLVNDHQILATVPADAHLDLTAVIDSGIETEHTLIGNTLTLRLPPPE